MRDRNHHTRFGLVLPYFHTTNGNVTNNHVTASQLPRQFSSRNQREPHGWPLRIVFTHGATAWTDIATVIGSYHIFIIIIHLGLINPVAVFAPLALRISVFRMTNILISCYTLHSVCTWKVILVIRMTINLIWFDFDLICIHGYIKFCLHIYVFIAWNILVLWYIFDYTIWLLSL